MGAVIFDIETIARPIPPEYKQGVKDGTLRVDNVTKEPIKVWAKMKEKFWAQAEGAKPVCIVFAEVDMAKRVVNEPVGYQSDDEKKLADFVIQALGGLGCTKLLGFNSKRFDFPILQRLVRLADNPLHKGIGKWDHIDIAEEVPMFFNVYRPLKGAPHSVASLFGLPSHETSGKDVAQLWEADVKNKTNKVLEYCKEDVVLTGNVFLQLSKLRNYL